MDLYEALNHDLDALAKRLEAELRETVSRKPTPQEASDLAEEVESDEAEVAYLKTTCGATVS